MKMKTLFKWIFKSLAALLVLALLAYGSPHLWAYATGGRYVGLSVHAEIVVAGGDFSYGIVAKAIAESKHAYRRHLLKSTVTCCIKKAVKAKHRKQVCTQLPD
jgi:hypothetical protein